MRRMLVGLLVCMLLAFAAIFLSVLLVPGDWVLFGLGIPMAVERFLVLGLSLVGVLFALYELVDL